MKFGCLSQKKWMTGISPHMNLIGNIPELTKLIPLYNILSMTLMDVRERAVVGGSLWTNERVVMKLFS